MGMYLNSVGLDEDVKSFAEAQIANGVYITPTYLEDLHNLIVAVKVNTKTKALTLTLDGDGETVEDEILMTADIVLCMINNIITEFDWEDEEVLDRETGVHNLGGLYPDGTTVKYLYN